MARAYIGTEWYKLALDLARLPKNQNATKTLSFHCPKCLSNGITVQLRYQSALFTHLEDHHSDEVKHKSKHIVQRKSTLPMEDFDIIFNENDSSTITQPRTNYDFVKDCQVLEVLLSTLN
jgi:hypothetical protein